MRQPWNRPGFSIAQLFAPLDGEVFSGERAFQDAVIRCFNAQLHQFPPHYGYRDAIMWAVRQGWLTVEGAMISVSLPVEAEVGAPAVAVAA
jgi:hypothetical protein